MVWGMSLLGYVIVKARFTKPLTNIIDRGKLVARETVEGAARERATSFPKSIMFVEPE